MVYLGLLRVYLGLVCCLFNKCFFRVYLRLVYGFLGVAFGVV